MDGPGQVVLPAFRLVVIGTDEDRVPTLEVLMRLLSTDTLSGFSHDKPPFVVSDSVMHLLAPCCGLLTEVATTMPNDSGLAVRIERSAMRMRQIIWHLFCVRSTRGSSFSFASSG